MPKFPVWMINRLIFQEISWDRFSARSPAFPGAEIIPGEGFLLVPSACFQYNRFWQRARPVMAGRAGVECRFFLPPNIAGGVMASQGALAELGPQWRFQA